MHHMRTDTAPLQWRLLARLLATLSLALLAGCSSVSLKRDEPAVAAEFRVDADDQVEVEVIAVDGVVITAEERARCAATLAERIRRAAKGTVANGAANTWRFTVQVLRYDHGDAFKRSVRAGMGAMHIETQVTMSAADGSQVGAFAANRTYDWGGTLGGQATIDDLEVMLGDYIGRRVASREEPAVIRSKSPLHAR